MSEETYAPTKRTQFVWVKDKAGNEYVCNAEEYPVACQSGAEIPFQRGYRDDLPMLILGLGALLN